MSLVATLIAAPGAVLSSHHTSDALSALRDGGATILDCRLLAEGTATDLFFEGLDSKTAHERLHALWPAGRIDIIVQHAVHRRKRLFISDMDSTVIENECIDEIADFAGVGAHVAAITERAMNGELDFKTALAERVALLKGLPESVLTRVFEERIRLTPGVKTLTATLHAHGVPSVLVSGGFTFFTARVAEAAGFDAHEANTLEIEHGTLTGRVVPPILDKQAKLEALNRHCARLGIAPQQALAAGDGANDLPMLLAAGLGVAYHAKPVVRAQAAAQINAGDLTALLYAQGYAREDWAA